MHYKGDSTANLFRPRTGGVYALTTAIETRESAALRFSGDARLGRAFRAGRRLLGDKVLLGT